MTSSIWMSSCSPPLSTTMTQKYHSSVSQPRLAHHRGAVAALVIASRRRTGALIGLFFHREDWLGGYNSWSRRLLRLGHIACFGLGLINILFALSAASLPPSPTLRLGSILLVVGMITMPLNCFLSAWQKPFRHAFFIPAGSTLIGIVCLLLSFP